LNQLALVFKPFVVYFKKKPMTGALKLGYNQGLFSQKFS
jgi:hypothetical protein